MPELPEVEHAAAIARAVAGGRIITSVTVRHPSQRRGLPAKAARSLVGDRVLFVERRGKSQRFRLASGRELRVHFRMTGDWLVPGPGRLPASVRAVFLTRTTGWDRMRWIPA
jgi:formamidopyrimidine-DNA glycosylase